MGRTDDDLDRSLLHVGDGQVQHHRAEQSDDRLAQFGSEARQHSAAACDYGDLDRIGLREGQPHPDHPAPGEVGGDGAERSARESHDSGMGEHGVGHGLGERGVLCHPATVAAAAQAASVSPVALTGAEVGDPGLDDVTLVVRAQEGDVRAFEVLARRYQGPLYRVALRVTGDHGEAEDALQEALLDAWRHLGRFRGEAAFSTWIYRIVTNRCVAALRRRRPLPDADAGTQVTTPDSPARAAELDAELAALGAGVQDLPYDQRVCWVLRELEGMGYAEIAEITGAGEVAVRGRIHRARVRLAEVMRAWR